MKCKSCGGDYRTRELICPYCGTENLVGRLWMAQRSEAELQYEKALKETGRKASPYVVNRVLGRIAVVMACLCILMFVAVAVFFMVLEGGKRIYKRMHYQEIVQTMERLYQEENYTELYAYMGKYDLIGEDNYAYSQAVLMDFDYQWFVNHKLKFCEMSEDEKQEDTYYLQATISWGADICQRNLGRYVELDPMNQALYDSYCQEVTEFWRYTLGMTEEEIERIAEDETLGSADYEQLAETLKERRAWE